MFGLIFLWIEPWRSIDAGCPSIEQCQTDARSSQQSKVAFPATAGLISGGSPLANSRTLTCASRRFMNREVYFGLLADCPFEH
jgi:hypothetical protein